MSIIKILDEKTRITGETGKYRGLETVERLVSNVNKGRMTKKEAMSYLLCEKQYLMEKVCGATDAESRARYTGELEGLTIGKPYIEQALDTLVEALLLTELDEGCLMTECKANIRTGQIQGITRSESCPPVEMVIIGDDEYMVVSDRCEARILQETTGDTVFWY